MPGPLGRRDRHLAVDGGVPGITEIQAGTYVVLDNYHGQMVPGFEHSLTIQASVISRQSDRIIVDAGISRPRCRT